MLINVHFSASEFNTFHLKYDPEMAGHDFKFKEGEVAIVKELIGNREKIIFFFLGHEDYLHSHCEYWIF